MLHEMEIPSMAPQPTATACHGQLMRQRRSVVRSKDTKIFGRCSWKANSRRTRPKGSDGILRGLGGLVSPFCSRFFVALRFANHLLAGGAQAVSTIFHATLDPKTMFLFFSGLTPRSSIQLALDTSIQKIPKVGVECHKRYRPKEGQIDIWRFPKMGVPISHPFSWIFSL